MKNVLKGLILFVSIICAYGSVIAQDVAVYKDKEPAWIDPAQMVAAIEPAFQAKGIDYKVVKAPELVTYMKANKTGIVIMTTGIAPSDIFKNQGDKDLVNTWLKDGGVMFWTGDWPFYYFDAPANCPAAAGEISVFGVTITAGPGSINMIPTEVGEKLMPSLKEHTSQRPIMLGTLESNKFNYESYADDGKTYADPIALQTAKMTGWFVNFHTWPENEDLKTIAIQMGELIINRFLLSKAVDSSGKLPVTWGDIKDQR